MTSQEESKASGSEEQQMQEMRRRLTEADVYDEGMNFQQMKDIIYVLDESKNMHQKTQTQSPSESPPVEEPPSISPPKTPKEHFTEAPKKTYSSAVESSKSSSENMVPARRGSIEGNSASESKGESFQKENTTPRHIPSDLEKKIRRKKKLSLDPLKSVHNENDRPLLKPERQLIDECEPFSLSNDLKNSEFTPQKLVQKMSDYLQEVRDEWITHTKSSADDSEFEWGSPIKVGSRNFHLDRKSVTRDEPEGVEPMRESRSRASKRKAATLIANINNVSDNEPEADDDSALLKKRKPQQEGRNTTGGGSDVQMDVDTEAIHFETPSTSSRFLYFANDTKIEISEDEEDIFEPQVKSKSPETFYPRRIIPPNAGTNKARRGRARGKTNYQGPRAKKPTENSNKTAETETVSPSQKISPPEIVLDNDDIEFDDLSKPTDVKMLKLPLKEKTKLANKKLEEINKQDKQRIEQEKFYDDMFQEEKAKQKEELIRRRLAEEEEGERLAKEKEERENKKKKMWNKVLNDRGKKKEKSKRLSDEEIRKELEENDVVLCVDQPLVHISGSTSENRLPCPICNKFFPENVIENHASECNQFELETEETSSPVINIHRRKTNNVVKQTCHICDDYEMLDETDYIEHIHVCAEVHRKRRDSAVSRNEVEYQGNFSSGRKSFTSKGRKHN